jgi:hypothetical protein
MKVQARTNIMNMLAFNFSTPNIFSNAADDPDDIDFTIGLRLEIKAYDSRFNSRGERSLLQAGVSRRAQEPRDVDSDSAFVLVRVYDRSKDLEYSEMVVRSPYIRQALKAVIKSYPGLSFDTGKVVIRNELRCIFHYRAELQAYGMQLQDEIAAQHLVFFLNHMYGTLSREISSYFAFIEHPSITPGIEHEFLWMAFRPGDLIYMREKDIHRILELENVIYNPWATRWRLHLKKVAFDGESWGYSSVYVSIHWYEGYKPLKSLRAYPLKFHPEADIIMQNAISRGMKYVGLPGIHHFNYIGLAESLAPYRIVSIDGEEDYYAVQDITVCGPI